jgi:hypothetical protein
MLLMSNLALSREGPPVSGFAGTNLMNCGREYIPNARIVSARRPNVAQAHECVGGAVLAPHGSAAHEATSLHISIA